MQQELEESIGAEPEGHPLIAGTGGFRKARWRRATQAGLVPLTVGFVAASGYIIMRAADHSVTAFVISAVTLLVAVATRVNPLWMFLVGGILGAFALV